MHDKQIIITKCPIGRSAKAIKSIINWLDFPVLSTIKPYNSKETNTPGFRSGGNINATACMHKICSDLLLLLVFHSCLAYCAQYATGYCQVTGNFDNNGW